MRVWDTGGGDYYAAETESEVRVHILEECGDPEQLKDLTEVDPEKHTLNIDITFTEEVARLKAKGTKFPICIASENS